MSSRVKLGSRMSQNEAAEYLGIPIMKYHHIETSKIPDREIRLVLDTIRAEEMSPPTLGERCALARRRSKLGLAKVAGALGISRVAYLTGERSGAANVVSFWERQGYRF